MSGRKAYFSAADRAPAAGGSATNQQTAAATRQRLVQDLTFKAERVAAAIKIMRALDTTGHVLDAMPHLQIAVEDLNAAYRALAQDVANFVGRDSSRPPGTGAAFKREQLAGLGQSIKEHAEALQASFNGPAYFSVDVNDAGDSLEASIRRHPAGSALAEVDAAEAKAAGEPPMPAPLASPYTHPSMPGPYPKPGPDPYRIHRNYPG